MSAIKEQFAKFIGRTVRCEDGKRRKIETIGHSFVHPQKAVINESHFIHYLDLFGQMNGEFITKEDRKLFKEAFEGLDGKETHKFKVQS